MNESPAPLPEWAEELVENAPVARLGLLDEDDRPRVLPVTFARCCGRLWSAVDRKPKRAGRPPARLRYLERRPEVALTIDRYEDDWERLAWVQLLGRARVVAAERAPEAIRALAARYEQYRQQPPPGPLIGIEVERALHWRAREDR